MSAEPTRVQVASNGESAAQIEIIGDGAQRFEGARIGDGENGNAAPSPRKGTKTALGRRGVPRGLGVNALVHWAETSRDEN